MGIQGPARRVQGKNRYAKNSSTDGSRARRHACWCAVSGGLPSPTGLAPSVKSRAVAVSLSVNTISVPVKSMLPSFHASPLAVLTWLVAIGDGRREVGRFGASARVGGLWVVPRINNQTCSSSAHRTAREAHQTSR